MLPSAQEDLKYSDWVKMVSGLMDDTPLGRVVGIRSETDNDIIKNYSPEQRAARDEWSRFLASRAKSTAFTKEDEANWYKRMSEIERSFAAAFGR